MEKKQQPDEEVKKPSYVGELEEIAKEKTQNVAFHA